MTVIAILLVLILWIVTVREGHNLLNQDRPDTTEPVPYDGRENGEKK